VYVHGRLVGDTMTQLSVGFQAGGKAYSQIIFFKDKRALDEFESGTFEFVAGASALAIRRSFSECRHERTWRWGERRTERAAPCWLAKSQHSGWI